MTDSKGVLYILSLTQVEYYTKASIRILLVYCTLKSRLKSPKAFKSRDIPLIWRYIAIHVCHVESCVVTIVHSLLYDEADHLNFILIYF